MTMVEDKVLHGALSELENAVIAFFWVGDKPKMGSLSASLPDRSGSQLLGDRDEMLPSNHGFDEFFGNLYHLNAEEEPENEDYPKNPEFYKKHAHTYGMCSQYLHAWHPL